MVGRLVTAIRAGLEERPLEPGEVREVTLRSLHQRGGPRPNLAALALGQRLAEVAGGAGCLVGWQLGGSVITLRRLP